MKPGRLFLLFMLLLIGVIIYVNKCTNEKTEASGNTKSMQQPMIVQGILASAQDIEEKIYASGTLLANEEVELRNEVAGKITSILFKEGTRVKKGDLLITLFDDDLIAQRKKLELQKDIYKKTEERQRDLLSINGISQQEYELSQNQMMTVDADLSLINSQLSKTKIRAPFDGIIGLKNVSTGSYIAINTLIASVQEIDPVKLEFTIPERYRPTIDENTEIEFTTESSEGTFKGKIYAIEPKINLQTRTVKVRAISPNREMKLFPGAFASIQVPLKKISNAILVPTQTLIPELRGQKIYVARNGKAEKLSVETGLRNDSSIQITSGIVEGDTILTTGLMQMRPGSPVKVKVIK